MNKPYLLIAGENFYPFRDTGNWVGCFSSRDEARAQIKLRSPNGYTVNGRGCDWYKIVDLREWTE